VQVGLCRITVLADHCHSLKEKRAVVRSIKDKVFARHKILVAEVGGQDTWQRVVLGFAVVGSDAVVVAKTCEAVITQIEGLGEGRVVDVQREVEPYGDERIVADVMEGLDSWMPKFAEEDPLE
jgi:uncharacterized protein YlxP (DUF503 family)